ncbi:PAS domain S-box protein [Methanoculleus sp. Wushi-C6]|uniref:PAS domain S-box protein n=1 Tax=Methanoculleus caldifontis TaxID=2651577 RepID=A0ABU3X3B8_9EURY|nr:PAS domain S-box protein [Methanoculleus sp. Wushi-C6]MDV2482531.1 PAS domain S-box protein [Methanoculleus sp. Wushi-C6]
MESEPDPSAAELLQMLRDEALDPRSRERLRDGIETLVDENRSLAARAVRAEAERDALLAAIGRQGAVYDRDGRVIAARSDEETGIARALSGNGETAGDVSVSYPDGRPVEPGDLPGDRALAGEDLRSCRLTVRDRSGRIVRLAVSASPVVTSGAISGAAVTWQDVTGEEIDPLFSGLFENLGDIVGIQFPDHTILRYNRAGYEILGVTPEEAKGRKCYKLIGRAGPCTVCATDRALASRRLAVVEKFVPELGRHLECRSSPILDERGEVVFVIEQLYDITDRKRAEDERRAGEVTARALLDAPEELIVLLDPEGRLIDANETSIRRFGLSRESLIGTSLSDLFPPDVAGMYAARLHEVAVSGKPARFEDMWEGRLYDTVLYPVRGADGTVTRIAVTSRDITDRRRVEDALRSLTHDLNERVKELSCLYGISRIVERPGISLDEIFREAALVLPSGWQYPEDAAARITIRGRGFETEGFRETPWRQASPVVVHGEMVGAVEVCYIREMPEADEGPFLREERALVDTVAGRLGRTIELFQAREHLEKTESQFREITQQSFDMIYTCYHDGGIAYISPAVIRILGYTPGELTGRKCRDYVAPSSLPVWEEGRKKVVRGEPVEGLEIEFRRKDGSVAFLELNESPIVRERSVIGVHVVGRDVTERKQNEQLRQQAFEQIERNIEQFAILGDHIRQPLQVILGMSELFDEERITGRIREQVDRINGYITDLDRGWIESRQVREFLRKHELA